VWCRGQVAGAEFTLHTADLVTEQTYHHHHHHPRPVVRSLDRICYRCASSPTLYGRSDWLHSVIDMQPVLPPSARQNGKPNKKSKTANAAPHDAVLLQCQKVLLYCTVLYCTVLYCTTCNTPCKQVSTGQCQITCSSEHLLHTALLPI
jgi:hypothetical protein